MKKVNLSALTATLILASVSCSVQALQALDGEPGKKHTVRIPAQELTRLSIANGRVSSLRHVSSELEVVKDAEAGAVFIKPLVRDKQISAFVMSSAGAIHELIFEPVDAMPLESIVIREPIARSQSEVGTRGAGQATALDDAIKRLMLTMARQEKTSPVAVWQPMEMPLALWDGTRFAMTGRYLARNMIGEVYQLTNTGGQVMTVAEQEFFRPGVLAVALDQLVLRPGESTGVLVIRVAENG